MDPGLRRDDGQAGYWNGRALGTGRTLDRTIRTCKTVHGMEMQAILIWVAIGLIAGWLASIVVGGGGLIRNIITGLIGAVVGGFLVRYFEIPVDLGNGFVDQVVIAAFGAVLVVGFAKLIA